MKAMILAHPQPIEENPLQPADLAVPVPGNDEILIRTLVCGACHTDLDEAEGRLVPTKSPIVPGHQVRTGRPCGRHLALFHVRPL